MIFKRFNNRKNNRQKIIERASKDPNSIGNMLKECVGISDKDLQEGLDLQKRLMEEEEKEILLGEVLIQLEKITREQLEIVRKKQEVRKNGGSKLVITEIERAIKQTREASSSLERITILAAQVEDKFK